MTELEVSVPGVGQRRRELRCGMAGRSYDRQGSGRRGYLCHVHPLWSLDPRPHSGLCRVTSILVDLPYRWACVTLRLERESVWPSFGSVYEVSLEGCMMLWDLT